MDGHTIRKLELNKVLDAVSVYTETALGQHLIKEVTPISDLARIERMQEEVDQCSQLLQIEGPIPFGGISDIYPALKKAAKGFVLSASDFIAISATIYGAGRVKDYLQKFEERSDQLTIILEIAEDIGDFKELGRAIDKIFDNKGQIRDDASPKLQAIRREKNNMSSRIKDKLDNTLTSARYEKFIQENVITIRNGRFVVPIKAEAKAFFPGIIHDRSASGQTVFIEPQGVVELNNKLRILEQDEEDEIYRIFKELTELVVEQEDGLKSSLDALAHLDFTMAKARYGHENNCCKPILNSKGSIVLYQARHPLLKGNVVPIDIVLGTSYNTLVITGPNTGGKTVSLKTAGLLSLMAQSGLPIPAKSGSEVAVFNGIYVDIGDEQSIEQSLSTFSSHLAQIIRILAIAKAGDLVLLDEVGAGTDPEEGAALAMAILDFLHQRKILTIATTHYSELKIYAYTKEGLENAAVEFDVETLSPTFRLLIGVPGKSNAFAIASRLGLASEIIENAAKMVKQDRTNLENLISRIEREEYALLNEKDQLGQEQERLANLMISLQREREKEKKEMETLKTKLYQESRDLLQEIKEEGALMLKKIRGFGGPPADRMANDFNLSIQEKEKRLKDLQVLHKEDRALNDSGQVKVGDMVLLLGLNQKGRVVNINNEQAYVQVGMLNLWVELKDIRVIDDKEEIRGGKKIAKLQGQKALNISSSLDLRGVRWEEAREKADKYIDDAYLAGLKRIEIIHGKGTGALREGIHDLLKDHYHVKEFRLGDPGEGGSGVTIVSL